MTHLANCLRKANASSQIQSYLRYFRSSILQGEAEKAQGWHLQIAQSTSISSGVIQQKRNWGDVEYSKEDFAEDFLEWRGPEPGVATQVSSDRNKRHLGAPHRSSSHRIPMPPETVIPPDAFPRGEIRVGKESDVKLVGGAIANSLRKDNECTVLASGRDAVNQATKSLALARKYINDRDGGQAWFQSNHLYRHDRNTGNQFLFVGKRADQPFTLGDDVDIFRSKGAINVLNLASAISAVLHKKQVVVVAAMGVPSITAALVSITWTRRFLIKEGLDLHFYPEFKSVQQENSNLLCVIHFIVKLTKSEAPHQSNEPGQLAAVKPLGFIVPLEELKPFQDAFATFSPKSLPNMKIGAASHGNALASVLASQLRFFPGMHLLCAGEVAGTVSFKTLCIARTYVREVQGYDLGLQCIHAPSNFTDGNCQVSIWSLLVKYQKSGEKEDFKVNQKTSARDTGVACAHKLRKDGALSLVAMGVACVSKIFVVLSFARSFVERDKLDVVGFPYFDDARIQSDDGTTRDVVRFKMDLVLFNKKEHKPPLKQEGGVGF